MNRSYQSSQLERIGDRLDAIKAVLKRDPTRRRALRAHARFGTRLAALRRELDSPGYDGALLQDRIDTLDAKTRALRGKVGLAGSRRD